MTTPIAAPANAAGLISIDLAALAANWRLLATRAAPEGCGAVIKANGYGLGGDLVAKAHYGAGCRNFFVAHLDEGRRARAVLADATARIYVLDGLQWGADPFDDYARHGLAPAIGSAEELARWASFNRSRATPAPCALHLDTGMNRLGFASLQELLAAMTEHGAASGADLLLSHFVSAEEPGNPLNALQIARFEAARRALPHLPASLANSSGAFLAGVAYDLIRPGYALFGGNPTPGAPNPMRAVVTLHVRIQQTRWIEAGQTCGYNGQWTARRRTRLATLLAGYADGLPRGAGAVDGREGARVAIARTRCPLVGRISMDLCIADITDLNAADAQPGGFAEFFGADMPLDDFAARSGTIGYRVLTGLSRRFARRIIG